MSLSGPHKSPELPPADVYRRRLRTAGIWLTLGLATMPVFRRGFRRALQGVMRAALRLRSRDYLAKSAGPLLIFAPHADDEALGCGGLICHETRRGVAVHLAYLTDGSGSHPNHPLLTPTALAARRRQEALTALHILGVEPTAVDFLDALDGTLARLPAGVRCELCNRISKLITRIQPRIIFLPCRRDGSSEHDAAFELVTAALAGTPLRPRVLEYPVWSWWNPSLLFAPLRRSRKIWRLPLQDAAEPKRRAIAEYATQVQPTPPMSEAVLSQEFLSYFYSGEEFFFER